MNTAGAWDGRALVAPMQAWRRGDSISDFTSRRPSNYRPFLLRERNSRADVRPAPLAKRLCSSTDHGGGKRRGVIADFSSSPYEPAPFTSRRRGSWILARHPLAVRSYPSWISELRRKSPDGGMDCVILAGAPAVLRHGRDVPGWSAC